VGGKKVKVSENQIGLNEVASEFVVPVVVGARKAKAAIRTAALDLAKRPQTWLKLLSLEDYLPVWFAKISNLATDAYYLDFFAGPGAYVNGLATAKGGPNQSLPASTSTRRGANSATSSASASAAMSSCARRRRPDGLPFVHLETFARFDQ
jgi:hypothetical protein